MIRIATIYGRVATDFRQFNVSDGIQLFGSDSRITVILLRLEYHCSRMHQS